MSGHDQIEALARLGRSFKDAMLAAENMGFRMECLQVAADAPESLIECWAIQAVTKAQTAADRFHLMQSRACRSERFGPGGCE